MDEYRYMKQVHEHLECLRKYLLGQDVQILSILPEQCRSLPVQEQAAQAAKQILFMLADLLPAASPEELLQMLHWLYGIVLFLELRCNPGDRTFGNLIKVARLERETRAFMFDVPDVDETVDTVFRPLREDEAPPFQAAELEEVIVSLLWERVNLEARISEQSVSQLQ